MNSSKRITLALTGASGAQYGLRLLQLLLAAGCEVHFLVSDAARKVIEVETDEQFPAATDELHDYLCQRFGARPEQLKVFGRDDWMSPPASGSSAPASMVICPCSGGTLAAIAHGLSNNLIERAADVALKERRQLIVVPREMPYSAVHLENMLTLTRMGAVVMPASPGFYHRPQSVDDMVDFVVARILDHLGLDQRLIARWGE
jgi:4-hydroxy-3-polyprenylbenzoate decarboxylase